MSQYDAAIIGGGPAGLSAAINLAARNKTCVVLSREKHTSWLYKAEKIDNHLGMPQMSGEKMLDAFLNHAANLNIEMRTGRVMQIHPSGKGFMVQFEQEIIEAKKIILAMGISKSKGLEGEQNYIGKGVSYCATCDGMLYRGKRVIVISDIEEGAEDAAFLAGICKSTDYLPLNKEANTPNSVYNTISGKPTEIYGGEFAEGVVINGERRNYDGIFIIKASLPAENLIFGLETSGGHVSVNRMAETNINGVYACGDCTGWPYAVSKAVGEGLVAAQAAARDM